uniref:Uncharacterized protein n=1 Tax=Glossina austeni TaxID=7395 RepID=A0A1A9UJI6_GLOAU
MSSLNANINVINDNDMISPVIMARYLEDELKAGEVKHCDTCQCSKDLTVLADLTRSYTVATQTPFTLNASSSGNLNEPLTQLCLRCYSNLNSPSRTNSPYATKNLLKSSDSVISETKSSMSDLNDAEKLFTPAKKDDLMVNPILGHHRLCERTLASGATTGKATQKTTYSVVLDNMKTATVGYHQRRFMDGGGTALDMLEEHTMLTKKKTIDDLNGNEELEEEAKPLLSNSRSHSNLLEDCEESLKTQIKLKDREHMKSPSASTCSAIKSHANSLLKSHITGSANSLWSRASSGCEGAKMFETFNRNLIKTIKAENPKNRGPRLCAMRIQQNGQSNILLDNIESIEAVTPIIYRRRERLLDEELEDGKEVITSSQTGLSPNNGEGIKHSNNGASITTKGKLKMVSDVNDTGGGGGAVEVVSMNTKITVKDSVSNTIGDEIKTEIDETKTLGVTPNGFEVSSKKSSNTNTGTQSSSLSEAIDFQESVLMRRQQLSRVAEWVQNNSQQMERQQQQQQVLSTLIQCDSSGTDQPSSFSTLDQLDSVSVEKLSLDSGYKTTPQITALANSSQDDTIKTSDESLSPKSDDNADNGDMIVTTQLKENSQIYSTPQTYYRRTSRSGLPVAYTAATAANTVVTCSSDNPDSSSQSSQIIPEQPTCDILNYKYYPNDSDKTRAIKAELHTTTQNVDIAQMEYNVKQFLLKQNEWSMRTTRVHTTPTTTTTFSNSTISSRPSNSLRHIKLFSNTNIGPGIGERVRTTTTVSTSITPTTITTTSTITSKGNNRLAIKATRTENMETDFHTTTTATRIGVTGTKIPQRTETNL